MEDKNGINRIEDEDEFEEETLDEEALEEPGCETAESDADGEPDDASSAETPDESKEEEPEEAAPEEAVHDKTAQEKPGTSDDGASGKGGPFRRKEKKDKKDEQIEELNDRVRRQMAEFDNYRKRTEKEKSQMFEMGAKSVIEKILPVVDNFERGLESIPDEEKDGAFAEGMDKVYRQMMSTLDEIGVKAIEAEGVEFDPNLHNAVMHVDDEDLGENIVAQELQKGYTYHDSVVRHSMVKVAN